IPHARPAGVHRLLAPERAQALGLNQAPASAAKALITSGGACTISISTPSPDTGNSSLDLGCKKQMSKPAAPLRLPPGAKRTPCAVSHSTALGRSSIHRPT